MAFLGGGRHLKPLCWLLFFAFCSVPSPGQMAAGPTAPSVTPTTTARLSHNAHLSPKPAAGQGHRRGTEESAEGRGKGQESGRCPPGMGLLRGPDPLALRQTLQGRGAGPRASAWGPPGDPQSPAISSVLATHRANGWLQIVSKGSSSFLKMLRG